MCSGRARVSARVDAAASSCARMVQQFGLWTRSESGRSARERGSSCKTSLCFLCVRRAPCPNPVVTFVQGFRDSTGSTHHRCEHTSRGFTGTNRYQRMPSLALHERRHGLLEHPRRCCCSVVLTLLLLTAIAYATMYITVCGHCNRIGNFLDSWYQRSLIHELSRATAAGNHSAPRGPWSESFMNYDVHLHGVGWGVTLRRLLRLDYTPSIAMHAYRQHAIRVPPASFWLSVEGQELMTQLHHGNARDSHFWASQRQLRALIPYLRPSLRALIRSFDESRNMVHGVQSHEDRCVVHYRAGDFLSETGATAERAANAVASAALTLPRPCRIIEVLDGGVTQHVCTGTNCGGEMLQKLTLALQSTFPNATLEHHSGTPEADFVRMAQAPMLIVGGGSYATFAALASVGEARMPRCILKFGVDGACIAEGASYAKGLKAYAHPMCKCRHHPPALTYKLTSKRTPPRYSRIVTWAERGVQKLAAAALSITSHATHTEFYSLPLQDQIWLHRALARAEGIYLNRRPGTHASRAVLVTSFNAAYLELYHNWACHAGKLGLQWLVWAQERHTARELQVQSRSGKGALYFSEHMALALGAVPWGSSFRSYSFNRLSSFKLVVVKLILESGRDVFFCDVDVVFLRDPWPLFQRAQEPSSERRKRSTPPTCDYEYLANERCKDPISPGQDATLEGNTGFHLFIRNTRSLQLLTATLQLVSAHPDIDDQTLLWRALHAKLRASHARFVCPHVNVSLVRGSQSCMVGVAKTRRAGGGAAFTAESHAHQPKKRSFREALADVASQPPQTYDASWWARDALLRPGRAIRPALEEPMGAKPITPLAYCVLPRRTHVSGACFNSANSHHALRSAAVAHANWVSGHVRKRAKLVGAGLWADSETCSELNQLPPMSWRASVWRLASYVFESLMHGLGFSTGRAVLVSAL